MGIKISKANSLECLAVLVLFGLVFQVFYQSLVGHHFIIPTGYLAVAVLLGNIIYYGFKGYLWPKIIFFWLFVLADFCALLSLFYSPMLARNADFMPAVGAIVVIFTILLYFYQKTNKLYKH